MKNVVGYFLLPCTFFCLFFIPGFFPVHAQIEDILEVGAEKYFIEVDGESFKIFYGYKGSFESEIETIPPAIISDIFLDQDNKSVNISLEQVPQKQLFWIVLPTELISAEKGQYQLLVDNVETGYELTKMTDSYTLGFYLPENAQSVQIIGTHVVPEFGSMVVIVMVISVLGIVLINSKYTKFC